MEQAEIVNNCLNAIKADEFIEEQMNGIRTLLHAPVELGNTATNQISIHIENIRKRKTEIMQSYGINEVV